MTILKYSDVSFAYAESTPVLTNINLEFNSHEIVGILGPNGAGKSTLLKLANGLLKPLSGKILINNEEIIKRRTSDISKDLIVTFQFSRQQFFRTTVESEISVTLALHVKNKTERVIRLEKLLQKFNLIPLRHHHPYVLSGGEQRRLALALAFTGPTARLYLLDEPTANIDHQSLVLLKSTLKEMSNQGKGFIIVSHDIEFQLDLCDRIIIIGGTSVQFSGTPIELIRTNRKDRWNFFEIPQIYDFIRSLEENNPSSDLLGQYLAQTNYENKVKLISKVFGGE
ncbi:MAG: energy-coupling factor ABC transporter ATP-binding protein [Candidatus Hodarchaeales archaeon]|jgi:energy-coupling factor transporter ATP-binding protein EcfA2